MATVNPTAAQQLQAAQLAQGLRSPYDGTSPTNPLGAGFLPGAPNLGAARPGAQVNATNQTAVATNGDVNQHVTNANTYNTRNYTVIMPGGGSWLGGLGLGGLGHGGGQAFIDPQTGVVYMRKEEGITGWLKRLFRGY